MPRPSVKEDIPPNRRKYLVVASLATCIILAVIKSFRFGLKTSTNYYLHFQADSNVFKEVGVTSSTMTSTVATAAQSYNEKEREKFKSSSSSSSSLSTHKKLQGREKTPAYILEPCPKCSSRKHNIIMRDGLNGTNTSCYDQVQRLLHENSIMSVVNATSIIAAKYPKYCLQCHPNLAICQKDDAEKALYDGEQSHKEPQPHASMKAKSTTRRTNYYKLDAVISKQHISRSATQYFQSIPSMHRIPEAAWEVTDSNKNSLTNYLSNASNVYPERTYLFEYNPSIVQIPKSQRPKHDGNDEAVYLASYIITNYGMCVYNPDDYLMMIGGQYPRPPQITYLGLALLRDDLTIYKETVINMHNIFKKYQDFRLFVLNEQIYITSFTFILPIWIINPPSSGRTDYKKETSVFATTSNASSSFDVYFRFFASCVPGLTVGKNLIYFWNEELQLPMVEVWPMRGSKTAVDLDKYCGRKGVQENRNVSPPTSNATTQSNSSSSRPILPKPSLSYHSEDELHFKWHGINKPPITKERGSACCVDIDHPTNRGQKLLVAISHSKFVFINAALRHSLPGNVESNTFMSKFYAMEPYEPYNVIAISGNFCLGLHDLDNDFEARQNPYANKTVDRRLRIGRLMDCPAIHFISGIVENVNDPSRVIIAYGHNDCTPRMIEVSKQHIVDLLFPPS